MHGNTSHVVQLAQQLYELCTLSCVAQFRLCCLCDTLADCLVGFIQRCLLCLPFLLPGLCAQQTFANTLHTIK